MSPLPPPHTPRKPPAERRDAPSVLVRLNRHERALLEQIAASRGMSLGAALRALAFHQEMPSQRPSKFDQAAYLELARLGNNLNQIARQLNTVHMVPPFERLAESVAELRTLLQAVHVEVLR